MKIPPKQIEADPDGISPTSLQNLRFPMELENEFREDYSRKVLPGLRSGLILLLGIFLLQCASSLISTPTLPITMAAGLIVLGLLLLTFHPCFPEIWQPCVVVTFCALDCLLILSGHSHAPPGTPASSGGGDASFRTNTLLLTELVVFILGFVLTRLRFVWFVIGCFAVAALQVLFAVIRARLPLEPFMLGTAIFVVPALAALIFVTYVQERGARSEFLANTRLARLHAAEHEKQEQTEGMLHILNQAIGGTVHDLGNPLTSVRTGAETLRLILEDAEPEMKAEMLNIVCEGAQMLDYLRLSLLEQTRVLAGKAIPLELGAASLRQIIEAGVHFQKPKFSTARHISAPSDDILLTVDSMKLITVFMNLIGNALKYSDGEIKITWQHHEDSLLIAVLDQGHASRGISKSQASHLFAAFSRLAAHAEIEGTGLGLLSSRKIVEAHGGEAFVEGYADGTPLSQQFTTSTSMYPSQLSGEFSTAFVVALPLSRAGVLVS